MTAHGLGAFVAWAGFAVMGFGYWVLESVGFKLRQFDFLLGQVAWWTMVVGTAGIVITSVIFQLGGSWVFLYPLPFHSARAMGPCRDRVLLASPCSWPAWRSSPGRCQSCSP